MSVAVKYVTKCIVPNSSNVVNVHTAT